MIAAGWPWRDRPGRTPPSSCRGDAGRDRRGGRKRPRGARQPSGRVAVRVPARRAAGHGRRGARARCAARRARCPPDGLPARSRHSLDGHASRHQVPAPGRERVPGRHRAEPGPDGGRRPGGRRRARHHRAEAHGGGAAPRRAELPAGGGGRQRPRHLHAGAGGTHQVVEPRRGAPQGYAADEIVGRHFSVFYPPEDVASGKPARELVIAGEMGRHEEEGCRVRKDGSRFWATVVITATRDPAGNLLGFAKITVAELDQCATSPSSRPASSERPRQP
jgi:hypothetical protein